MKEKNKDDEPIEKSVEKIEFEKYSKLFEERFGEKARIAEPGGTYKQLMQ